MNPEELKKTFAENIKRRRIELNLKQDQLAEKMNLSEKYISDLETGRRFGSFDTLVSLANCLQIEPYELFIPLNQAVSYDSRKTKELMKRLKGNIGDLLNTIEDFLSQK